MLAKELFDQLKHQVTTNKEIHSKAPRNIAVITPAGTGTTAFFLQKHLVTLARRASAEDPSQPISFQVYAVPVATSGHVLLKDMEAQFGQLGESVKVLGNLHRPNQFAQPDPRLLSIYQMMKCRHKVEVDLIYGTKAWQATFSHWTDLWAEYTDVVVLHTGGVTGNPSQLQRYSDICVCVL